MIMQFNLISRWPVTWCKCNMVYLFVKANFYLHLVHTDRSFWTSFREEILVSLWGKGHTRGVLSNVMGRKEIQGKWRGRERARYRGLRLPPLGYYRFFSELQSASALSVHSCSSFPSWAHLSIVGFYCHTIPCSSLTPWTLQKQAYLHFYMEQWHYSPENIDIHEVPQLKHFA